MQTHREENVRKTSEVEMVNSSEEIKSMVEKQAEEIEQLRRKLKQEEEEKEQVSARTAWLSVLGIIFQ